MLNFREYIEQKIWYHAANPASVDKIKEEGLQVNGSSYHTKAGDWARQIYKMNPIFISMQPMDMYSGAIFEVNVDGLKLIPDLPSIAQDAHALVDFDYNGGGFYWEEERDVPNHLKDYVDDDLYIWFEDIFSQDDLSNALIELTRTAAILQNIPPNKIRLVKGGKP